ncbi:peptidoglycan hydrolase CwlO-like protein [Gracilibacillus halotolerans]|uniref:Peptidoglycan hydrolase CwlO-like protein n=1 Tax=Gracilibacillus halotolerans TaxID=74386 RepID=A0A841RPI0_9BACI|nr:peptidoglycan hydrolase CwlO-like protein [Gracilibacillus halotolerans]
MVIADGRKFLVSAFVVLSLFFISFITVNAETKEEIQSKKAEVQSEITDKEKEIDKLAEELIHLNESLERTEKAIEDNQQAINEVEKDIQPLEEKVSKLEEEIAALQKAIDKRDEIIKKRIASLQENGGSYSYIEVLLGADNFIDFIDRFSLVNTILESDEALMQDQKNDKAKIEEKQAEFNAQLDELTDMKTEYEEMQRHVLEQKEQLEVTKKELEKKEQENKDILEDLKIEERLLERKEQAMREAEAMIQRDQELLTASAQPASNSNGVTQYAEVKENAAPKATSQPTGNKRQAVTTVGNRYIGNSVYTYAGGRTAYDVANGRFDCSGFVSWAFRQIGTNLPTSTDGLSSVGTKIPLSQAQPGDLVFFNTYKTNGHVGIYLGNNKFIGSQNSTGVAIADMNSNYWSKTFSGHVRRVLP